MGKLGGAYNMEYDAYSTTATFLTDVWYLLASFIEPYTYGKEWVLRERVTFRVLDVGTQWAESNGRSSDDRPLAQAGLRPGMQLDTIRMSWRSISS
jgi:hypothetical protein